MQHNITIDGYGYRLRPVTIEDAQFIVEVRTENAERTKYINRISTDIALQMQWIDNYYKTPDDYYFVIEKKSSRNPEGLISLYNIINNKGECGRWVTKQNSFAAVEGWYLLYRFAFEMLHLDEVFCKVITDNVSVVSFHKSVKQKIRETISSCYTIENIQYDAIEFYIDKDYFFNDIQPRMEKITKTVFRKT